MVSLRMSRCSRIEVFDIQLTTSAKQIVFRQCEVMGELSAEFVGYRTALLPARAGHFGLGRYGDPLDPDGHLKGIDNLHRILEPGGTSGGTNRRARIGFSTHRVLACQMCERCSRPRFDLRRFAWTTRANFTGCGRRRS
jgi:hypothetical protein